MDPSHSTEPQWLLAEAGYVHRLARALVKHHDTADDVAQDVLVAALRQSEAPQRSRAWLAVVAHRLASKQRRAARLRAEREAAAAAPEAGDPERRTAERLLLQQRLNDAMASLPEPYRTTVALRFFDELPPRTIAVRMATTSEVVRQRLHRGLDLLRARLDGEFGDRSSWVRACAALGALPSAGSWLLVSVLTMNKLAFVAAAVLVAGVFLWWPQAVPLLSPASAPSIAAATPTSNTTQQTAQAGSPDVAPGVRTTAGDATEPECAVLVVDAAAAPVANALVHTWAPHGYTRSLRTDAAGRASFGDLAGPGRLLVAADGHYPLLHELTERRGQHRLELPAGATIRGTVLVDSGLPTRPWRLYLRPIALGEGVPQPLAERFEWGVGCSVEVAGDGSFAFVGLPADWRGSLRLPSPLWLLPESGGMPGNPREIQVSAGDQLRLMTTQLPTLQVQLRWLDDDSPIANAQAYAYTTFDDERHTDGCDGSSDEQGLLHIGLSSIQSGDYVRWCDPVQRPAVRKVQLSVVAPGGNGPFEQVFAPPQQITDVVHTLRLPRAKVSHFVAVDRRGEPIQGALLEAHELSEPSDRLGRGTFFGTVQDVRTIGARGYCIIPATPRAPARGTAEDPLVFELLPSNSVRLLFRDGSGRPISTVTAVAETERTLLASGRMAPSRIDREFGSPFSGGSGRRGEGADGKETLSNCKLQLGRPTDGLIRIESLRPGQSCTLRVLDPMHQELLHHTFVTPSFGEHTTIEVVVPGHAHSLRGQVVGPAGAAIAGATVELRGRESQSGRMTKRSAADGTFEFAGIHTTAPLQFSVTAPGFATLRHELPPLQADVDALSLRLEPGHTVTVQVLDAADQPVDLHPHLLAEHRHDAVDEVGPGHLRFRDLPAGPVTFWCEVGNTRFELHQDSRQPAAVLRMPRLAQLALAATGGWPPVPDGTWLRVKAHRLDTAEAPIEITVDDAAGTTLLLPGRYRLELFEQRHFEGQEQPSERALGRTAEVTLMAGQTTRAELR